MLNNEFLRELSARIGTLVPMAAGVRKDVENSIQDVLRNAFDRLHLVTREEFEAQLRVLERAEQTIAALEEKLIALEQAQGLNGVPPRGGETP